MPASRGFRAKQSVSRISRISVLPVIASNAVPAPALTRRSKKTSAARVQVGAYSNDERGEVKRNIDDRAAGCFPVSRQSSVVTLHACRPAAGTARGA
jgi:hypothetical protein